MKSITGGGDQNNIFIPGHIFKKCFCSIFQALKQQMLNNRNLNYPGMRDRQQHSVSFIYFQYYWPTFPTIRVGKNICPSATDSFDR